MMRNKSILLSQVQTVHKHYHLNPHHHPKEAASILFRIQKKFCLEVICFVSSKPFWCPNTALVSIFLSAANKLQKMNSNNLFGTYELMKLLFGCFLAQVRLAWLVENFDPIHFSISLNDMYLPKKLVAG